MEKAYKYRIYPNKRQKELWAKTFGCYRFVYNHFLNKRMETYQNEQKTLTYNQCSSELTKLKSELEWLKEPDKCSLQKSLNKLARLQRELSRKTRGGFNWNKARIKVARLQEHIANQRTDFLQKLSTKLIRENDVTCIEDLQVKNMLQNHKLARCIADVSWSEFTRQLEYKADWYGKTLIKVDKWYASSQICNCCGHQFPITKDLSVREWICPNCHKALDRDGNAARNILSEGKRLLANVA